jgi:flagellar biosynthesis protein
MKNTSYQQAVALEYGKNKTPVVSAKGDDDLARRIVAEAKRQGVYVAQDPKLLAMLSRLDVGEEIPEEMFTAVAVILAWVYWIRGMQPGDEAVAVTK